MIIKVMVIKVKVILRSFENQIVSVWISIPKRAVGFVPNAYLTCYQYVYQWAHRSLSPTIHIHYSYNTLPMVSFLLEKL